MNSYIRNINFKEEDSLEKLRQRLHEIPERSMQERKTKETLMQYLQNKTDLEIVDRGHGFMPGRRQI